MTHNIHKIINYNNLKRWTQLNKTQKNNNLKKLKEIFDKKLYSYCLIDDLLIFSEIKPNNSKYFTLYDTWSKHVLICNSNYICLAGDLKIKNEKFIFNINSGSYQPIENDLNKLNKFKELFNIK
jgi:hypothetical protein